MHRLLSGLLVFASYFECSLFKVSSWNFYQQNSLRNIFSFLVVTTKNRDRCIFPRRYLLNEWQSSTNQIWMNYSRVFGSCTWSENSIFKFNTMIYIISDAEHWFAEILWRNWETLSIVQYLNNHFIANKSDYRSNKSRSSQQKDVHYFWLMHVPIMRIFLFPKQRKTENNLRTLNRQNRWRETIVREFQMKSF